MTSNILMIKPVAFGFNEQTAKDNYFQQKDNFSSNDIQDRALNEFNQMVDTLKILGVNVFSISDTVSPHTPDSIFPNNWISFHENGKIALYPMFAENRRAERRKDIVDILKDKGVKVTETIDYTETEKNTSPVFLEGTGSMVLDRENKIAYAAISKRTDYNLLLQFCKDFDYNPCAFNSYQTVD